MKVVIEVEEGDLGSVSLAAMCWVMGLPFTPQSEDEDDQRKFAEGVERVLSNVTDSRTGQPVQLVEGWWKK